MFHLNSHQVKQETRKKEQTNIIALQKDKTITKGTTDLSPSNTPDSIVSKSLPRTWIKVSQAKLSDKSFLQFFLLMFFASLIKILSIRSHIYEESRY
jgi:hypothetical protein